MLPNFLVIGSIKGGTTSLHEYLRSHPSIFMPEEKELRFFIDEINWGRGREWYERKFELGRGAIAVGEASPAYTAFPHYKGVPERIASMIPAARLLYIVRNPIQRIRSHYTQRVYAGLEELPVERALLENPLYLDCSRYAFQLDQYLKVFDRDQILVLTSEDLRADRGAVLRKVGEFLEIEAAFPAIPDVQFNVSVGKRVPGPLAKKLRKGRQGRWARRVMPEPIKKLVKRATHRQIPNDFVAIPDSLLEMLESALREDGTRLRSFMGEEFHGWGLG